MAEQRSRRQGGGQARATSTPTAPSFQEILDDHGPTEFVGREEVETKATVLAVVPGDDGTASVFLDRTPFYAESGGQVGDTGTLTTDTGRAEVLDTTYGLPGLHRHEVRIAEGTIEAGQEVTAAIDVERRDAIRRNHTGTHILHWALREVLGDTCKQQGSLVDPDRLRFDFGPSEALTARPDPPDRGPRQRARSSPTTPSATTRPPRPRPPRSAPSPSSATSTATSCGCSRPAATPPSSAAAPTCGPSATSAR